MERSSGSQLRLLDSQFIEQAPGPRGSPQLPQGSGEEAAAPFFVLAENTEICCSNFWLSQDGHRGTSPLERKTSHSNRSSQSKQAYSNIGIKRL